MSETEYAVKRAKVLLALGRYMALRKKLGGHLSKEGQELRTAWDAYEQALQS